MTRGGMRDTGNGRIPGCSFMAALRAVAWLEVSCNRPKTHFSRVLFYSYLATRRRSRGRDATTAYVTSRAQERRQFSEIEMAYRLCDRHSPLA